MSLSITSAAANIALRQLTVQPVKEAPQLERLTTGKRVDVAVEEPRQPAPQTVTSSINPLTIKEAVPDRSIDPVSRPAIEPIVSFDNDTGLYSAAVQPAETRQEPIPGQKARVSESYLLFERQNKSNTITFGNVYS